MFRQAAIFLLVLLIPVSAAAQFVETDCPLRHPQYPQARLDSISPLEDGLMPHDLPDFDYKEKDGSRISVIDYRFSNDLNYRQAKLRCRYDRAPDIFIDIPGLLTRCVRRTRDIDEKRLLFLRGYCESDTSPPPAANGQ